MIGFAPTAPTTSDPSAAAEVAVPEGSGRSRKCACILMFHY
jgi:hypothetical protein